MAGITLVNSTHGDIATSPLTVNVPSGVANGDLLIFTWELQINRPDLFTFPILTDAAGWTLIGQTDADTGGGNRNVCRVRSLYRVASSEPASYDWTWTGGSMNTAGGVMVAYRGVDTQTPLDAPFVGASDTSASNTDPGAIVTVTPNAMVITAPATFNIGATYTAVPTNQTEVVRAADVALAQNIVVSPGAFNPNIYTPPATAIWAAQTIALRPLIDPQNWAELDDIPLPEQGFAPAQREGAWV